MRSSPQTHFEGLFGRRTTGEADRRRQSFERPPMVTGDGWGDSGRGDARLEDGEGGGGGGEDLGARDRSRATQGRRSTGGGGSGLLCSSSGSTGKKRVEWE